MRALEVAAAREVPGDHVWDVIVARRKRRDGGNLSFYRECPIGPLVSSRTRLARTERQV